MKLFVYSIKLLVVFLYVLDCTSTRSQQTQNYKFSERLSSSIDVLTASDSIPDKSIPETVLKNAQGIAIIPSVIKGAFLLGGRYGKGVMSVKMDNGQWSYPGFITIGGGSIGWQWGVEAVDLVLVFKTRESADSATQGDFTLGASASVSAGPIGRHAEANTNDQFNAAVYSYARSRGLFLGASLEGASIKIDQTANKAFYNSDTVKTQDIFSNNIPSPPPEAIELVHTIDTLTGMK